MNGPKIKKIVPQKTLKSSEASKTKMPKIKRLRGCGCGKHE